MQSHISGPQGVVIVYGPFGPTPNPQPYSTDPWVWFSPANYSHVAVTVRLFGASDSLFICTSLPTSSSPCSASAVRSISIPVAADGSGLFKTIIGGLSPGTRYYWQVGTGPSGTFLSSPAPRTNFKFAAASCAASNQNPLVMRKIADGGNSFFLHTGDLHYQDITQNKTSLFLAAYDMALTVPNARSLWQAMGVDYVWDDHDFGPNDSDGNSPSRLASISAYSQAIPLLSPFPSSSCSPPTLEIFHSFVWGSVLVIRMDLRSQNFPGKSVMSSCQMEWLKQQLSQCSKYDLVILVSAFNWIGQAAASPYGWAEFTTDRTTLANTIDSNGCSDKLILVAGDSHMLAFDDGANSNYASSGSSNSKGFPVVQSAPMWRPGSIKGGPYSHGCSASAMAFSAFTQFEVSFVDSHSMCVSVTGMRVMQYKSSTVTDYTWTGCTPFRSKASSVGTSKSCKLTFGNQDTNADMIIFIIAAVSIFTLMAVVALIVKSPVLLSIIPTMDFDTACCKMFSSTILWHRKLLAGFKLLLFVLTCALAVASSFFSYLVSPVALAITFLLFTSLSVGCRSVMVIAFGRGGSYDKTPASELTDAATF